MKCVKHKSAAANKIHKTQDTRHKIQDTKKKAKAEDKKSLPRTAFKPK